MTRINRRPRRRILMAALAAAGLTASLVACSSNGGNDGGDDNGADAAGSYVLGINAELSGGLAFYGTTIRDGVQAWADQVNAEGGINGHEVELVILDNAGEAARSTTNMTQLATADNVVGVIGYTLSANCSAATTVAEREEIPIACLSVVESSPFVFSLGPNNASSANAALLMSVDLADKSDPRLAVAHANTASSKATADGIEAGAAEAGVDIVAKEEFDLAANDLSATSSKIVVSDPDVIVVTGTGPNFISILNAVRAAGVEAPVVWVDGTANLGSLAELDDPNVYAMVVHQFAPAEGAEGIAAAYVDASRPFLDEVTETTLASGENAVAYLTATAWGRALEECGYPCTGAELQPILSTFTTDLAPMVDEFDYDNELHYPYKNWYVYRVAPGGYELFGSYPAVLP